MPIIYEPTDAGPLRRFVHAALSCGVCASLGLLLCALFRASAVLGWVVAGFLFLAGPFPLLLGMCVVLMHRLLGRPPRRRPIPSPAEESLSCPTVDRPFRFRIEDVRVEEPTDRHGPRTILTGTLEEGAIRNGQAAALPTRDGAVATGFVRGILCRDGVDRLHVTSGQQVGTLGLMLLNRRREVVCGVATAQGLCVRCGYDLRATRGRCPECGAELAR